MDQILNCLRSFDAIDNISNLFLSKAIDEAFYIRILESQLGRLSNDPTVATFDKYQLWVVMAIPTGSSLSEPANKIIKKLGEAAIELGCCDFGIKYFKFISRCLKSGRILASNAKLKIRVPEWVSGYNKNMDEFIPISEIVSLLEKPQAILALTLREQYIARLSKEITSEVIYESLYHTVYEEDEYDASELINYIEERVSELSVDFSPTDVSMIASSFDLEELLKENRESRYDGTGEYLPYRSDNNEDLKDSLEIIDLFDRS